MHGAPSGTAGACRDRGIDGARKPPSSIGRAAGGRSSQPPQRRPRAGRNGARSDRRFERPPAARPTLEGGFRARYRSTVAAGPRHAAGCPMLGAAVVFVAREKYPSSVEAAAGARAHAAARSKDHSSHPPPIILVAAPPSTGYTPRPIQPHQSPALQPTWHIHLQHTFRFTFPRTCYTQPRFLARSY
jgi:hypothetical protein